MITLMLVWALQSDFIILTPVVIPEPAKPDCSKKEDRRCKT